MTSSLHAETFSISATDVTRQKTVKVSGVAPDITIGELMRGLVPKMKLAEQDADGSALTYQVRSEREGRQLHSSERAGEALKPNDRIVLQPNVMAG